MPNVIEGIADNPKPMDTATWWNKQPSRSMGVSLEEDEIHYLETFTSNEVPKELQIGRGIATIGSLDAEDKERAKKHFGTDLGAFVNFENRRRIIAHYVYTHPATINYMVQLYRATRDSIPPFFLAERVAQLIRGKETFVATDVSRLGAFVEIVIVLVIGRAVKYAAAAAEVAPKPSVARALTDPIYDLPPEGGGMNINGRWYTEHALERMAPDTPTVRAELRLRIIKRVQKLGLDENSDAYKKVLDRALEKGMDPRGIPPSVVEAEISSPGSTNIKVITARRKGIVVTVIPRR